jgi:HEAT repeat protein
MGYRCCALPCALVIIASCEMLFGSRCRADDDLIREKVRALQDRKTADRARVAHELARLGPKAKVAIPALIDALDDDPDVTREAALALTEIGADAVQPLAAALAGASEKRAAGAAKVLGQIGAGAGPAVPGLIKSLGSKSAGVRTAALDALGSIGDPTCIKALTERLRIDPDLKARRAAASGLQLFGPKAEPAIPQLVDSLKEYNARPKRPAAAGRRAGGLEEQLLQEAWDQFDTAVIGALGAVGKAAVPAVVPLLQSPEKGLRDNAMSVLCDIGAEAREAVPAVILCLKDKDPDIRIGAVQTLSSIGADNDEATVPALRKLYEDPSGRIRQLAAGVMLELKVPDKDALKILLDGLRDRDAGLRLGAAQSLHGLGLGSAEVIAALGAAATDKDKSVRREAAWALCDLAPKVPGAVPFVVKALADEDEDVRGIVLDKVRFISNERRLVPALVRCLGEPHGNLRYVAAEALEAQGAAAAPALPDLARLAKEDGDSDVRKAAARALDKIRKAMDKSPGKN